MTSLFILTSLSEFASNLAMAAPDIINLRGIDHFSDGLQDHGPLARIAAHSALFWFSQPWCQFAFLSGLVMGSFGNACIFRWPREQSVRFGRSHCPHCHATILWFDNIPLVSWILLMGRCRRCRGTISFRYPATELACGLAFAASYAGFLGPNIVASAFFLWALLVVFWIDMDHRIIPDEITLPFTLAGIFIAPWTMTSEHDLFFEQLLVFSGSEPFTLPRPAWALLGAIIGGGIVLLIRWLGQMYYKQEAMGMGDVKLLMLVGAWLGPAGALKTLFFGSIIGGVISLLLVIRRLVGMKDSIPFGPFLAAGAVLALFGLPVNIILIPLALVPQ